jgi:hypothetical protein
MIEEAFRTRPILDALHTRYANALELVILTDDTTTNIPSPVTTGNRRAPI